VRYGFHLSIQKGLLGSLEEAQQLGLSTFQIFVQNPRAWSSNPPSPKVIEAFRATRENLELPVVAHASYLIQLEAQGELAQKSVFSLAEQLQRAGLLGLEGVVVHAPGRDREALQAHLEAALRLAQGLRVPLLLENTAQGSLEALVPLLSDPRLGLCLDTCHAFAEGLRPLEALALIRERGALGRLKVIHLNDSQGELGSHLDRHAHLLKGTIGEELGEVLRFPGLQPLIILETPRSPEEDAYNLAVLKRWLSQAPAG